jgi:hypothetical protein
MLPLFGAYEHSPLSAKIRDEPHRELTLPEDKSRSKMVEHSPCTRSLECGEKFPNFDFLHSWIPF